MSDNGAVLATQWNQEWAHDGKVQVTFYKRAVLDVKATEGYWKGDPDNFSEKKAERVPGAGRPIFRDADFVKIIAGDAKNIVDREVKESDKQRWPDLWARYEANKDNEQTSGTPLEAWPGVTRAQVEELKFFKIRTVEALANYPDSSIQQIGPYRELRKKAQDWLARAEQLAPIENVRKENEDLKERMEAMAKQLAELQARSQSTQKHANKGA